MMQLSLMNADNPMDTKTKSEIETGNKKTVYKYRTTLYVLCTKQGYIMETYKLFHRYDQDIVPDLGNTRLMGQPEVISKSCIFQVLSGRKCKNPFCITVMKPWNSLNEALVNGLSVNSFENSLDKCWRRESIKYRFEPSTFGLRVNSGHDPANFKRQQNASHMIQDFQPFLLSENEKSFDMTI